MEARAELVCQRVRPRELVISAKRAGGPKTPRQTQDELGEGCFQARAGSCWRRREVEFIVEPQATD